MYVGKFIFPYHNVTISVFFSHIVQTLNIISDAFTLKDYSSCALLMIMMTKADKDMTSFCF